MTRRRFRVRIGDISCQDLPAKDSNGTSDPYLDLDFDNYKKARTPSEKKTLNPVWKGYSLEFFYETKFVDRLSKKVFRISCYDKDSLSYDDFIGSVNIDLQTICSGPVHHDLPLHDTGMPAGRIQLSIEMEELTEVTITLTDFSCRNLASPLPKDETFPKLSYFCSYDPLKVGHGEVCERTLQAQWNNLQQIWFELGLKDLLNEFLVLRVVNGQPSSDEDKKKRKKKKDVGEITLGECRISMHEFFGQDRQYGESQHVSRAIHGPEGAKVGILEGFISFANVPTLAQMVGGVHTEKGNSGAYSLLESSGPVPKGSNISTPPRASPCSTPTKQRKQMKPMPRFMPPSPSVDGPRSVFATPPPMGVQSQQQQMTLQEYNSLNKRIFKAFKERLDEESEKNTKLEMRVKELESREFGNPMHLEQKIADYLETGTTSFGAVAGNVKVLITEMAGAIDQLQHAVSSLRTELFEQKAKTKTRDKILLNLQEKLTRGNSVHKSRGRLERVDDELEEHHRHRQGQGQGHHHGNHHRNQRDGHKQHHSMRFSSPPPSRALPEAGHYSPEERVLSPRNTTDGQRVYSSEAKVNRSRSRRKDEKENDPVTLGEPTPEPERRSRSRGRANTPRRPPPTRALPVIDSLSSPSASRCSSESPPPRARKSKSPPPPPLPTTPTPKAQLDSEDFEADGDELHQQALSSLCDIATNNEHYRNEVARGQVLAQILNKARSSSDTKEHVKVCKTLRSIFSFDPQPSFKQGKATIPILAKFLQFEDEEVLTHSLWTLAYITQKVNERRIESVIEAGILPRLLQLVSHHNSDHIVAPALRVLGHVAEGDDRLAQELVEQGFIPILSSLLKDPELDRAVRTQCLWIVSNLTAGSLEQIQAVIDGDIIKHVNQEIVNANNAVNEGVKHALWVSHNITANGTEAQLRAFLKQEGFKPLHDCLSLLHEPELLLVAINALETVFLGREAGKREATPPLATHRLSVMLVKKLESLKKFTQDETVIEKAKNLAQTLRVKHFMVGA